MNSDWTGLVKRETTVKNVKIELKPCWVLFDRSQDGSAVAPRSPKVCERALLPVMAFPRVCSELSRACLITWHGSSPIHCNLGLIVMIACSFCD